MNKRILPFAGAIMLALGGTAGFAILGSFDEVCAAQQTVGFADDVMPIFRGYCFTCHQPGGQGSDKSGLDLSTYEGVMQGTKFGKMVIPGNPDSSNLMWLLDWKGAPETHMPLGKKKLSVCERNTIRSWIREGAKDN
jgi:mono/diheme cytochrome c family protein